MYKVNFSSFDCQGPKQSLEGERQIRCRVYTSLVKCRSSLPVTVKKLYKKVCCTSRIIVLLFSLSFSMLTPSSLLKLPTYWGDSVEPDVYMENRL